MDVLQGTDEGAHRCARARPGPYPGNPLDLDLNPDNYLNPAVLLSDMVTNPQCNVVVCNGTVPTAGLIQNLQALPGLL